MSRASVGNAADPEQVKEARKKANRERKQEIEDLRTVLSTQQGRRLLWRILGYCKVFESIWSPSAQIHHSAGRQDVGHFIMAEIAHANEEALFTMMREAKSEECKEKDEDEREP